MSKRRLQDEDPERAGEVDPTKPQFTPLLPPFQKPYPLEDGTDSYGKTIADCKAKFDTMHRGGFPGHPFIPPMPPDGGADPYLEGIMAGIDPASEDGDTTVETEMVPCPNCGGEGWIVGTRPSPEPEYDMCDVCHGDPFPLGDWCVACESGLEKAGMPDDDSFTLPCPECGEEADVYSTRLLHDTQDTGPFTGPIFFCVHGVCPGAHQSADRALTTRYPSAKT